MAALDADQSNNWLLTIQRAHDLPGHETLFILLDELETLDADTFPTTPPSALPDLAPSPAPASVPLPRRTANRFGTLDVDDDDEEETLANVRVQPAGSAELMGDFVLSRRCQCRYFKVYIICSIAERIRKRAIEFIHKRDYLSAANTWELAFSFPNERIGCLIDGWLAIREGIRESAQAGVTATFLDGHNQLHLDFVLRAVLLLGEDTERQQAKSLEILNNERSKLERKLRPLLQERDEIRSQMGVDRWESNPAPKQTYAERRRIWEEEFRAISAAILVIEALALFPRGNAV